MTELKRTLRAIIETTRCDWSVSHNCDPDCGTEVETQLLIPGAGNELRSGAWDTVRRGSREVRS